MIGFLMFPSGLSTLFRSGLSTLFRSGLTRGSRDIAQDTLIKPEENTEKIRVITLLCISLFLLASCSQDPVRIEDYSGASSGKRRVPYANRYSVAAPVIVAATKSDKSFRYVTVSAGDTVYALARRYDATLREIIDLNHLKPPYSLEIGDKLKLLKPNFHRVEKGETLFSIAKKHSINLKNLSKVNDIKASQPLLIGEKLRIPYQPKEAFNPSTFEGEARWGGNNYTPHPNPLPQEERGVSRVTPQEKPKIARKAPSKKTYEKRWDGKYIWPVKGRVISTFGAKKSGIRNDGINISAKSGAKIKAAAPGTVVYIGNKLKGYGNLLIIRHGNSWLTAYAHSKKFTVKRGNKVRKGEVIGYVGTSGKVTKPQLHFAIRNGKKAVDPLKYL